MYYLKCNNCGHLNKLDNEDLIICRKCNKKLENNFRDWQRKNSESSFEDFKKLVCITEQEIPSQSDIKKKTKSLKYWIGFAIVLVIFYAIGQIGGKKLVSIFKSEKTSKEVLSQEWTSETYGDFGLVVETPVIMTKMEVELPPQIQEVIEKMDMFQYNSANGFRVFISTIKYKPIVENADLQGAATGSANELRMQKGVTDFDYKEEEIVLNEIPGIKQTGSFKINDIPVEFLNTVYGNGLNLWQVMVAYPIDDEIGQIAAKRVIESVKIENIYVL